MAKQQPPQDAPLPRVRFDSEAQDSAARVGGFEAWHDMCRPVFEIEPLRQERGFKCGYEFVDVHGLIFCRTRFSATRFTRTASHTRADGADGFALHLLLRGKELADVGTGPTVQTGRDRVVLQDWSQPFVKESTAVEQLSLFVPRALMASNRRLPADRAALSWSRDSPVGRLLDTAMLAMWTDLPKMTASQAPSAAAGIVGLLNGLVDRETQDTVHAAQYDDAMFDAMKAYLLERLGDPSLGVNQLMETFHCSRAKVYRLFTDLGGIRAFIQAQRLEAVRRELMRSQSSALVVRQIAQRYGFEDAPYFYRLFKKRFGMTPGDAIHLADHEQQDGTSSDLAEADAIQSVHRMLGFQAD